MKRIAAFILLFLLAGQAFATEPTYKPQVLKELPHDHTASTQGLTFGEFDGKKALYESSGGFGKSNLRILDAETGLILLLQDFEGRYFAEGTELTENGLHVLTWLAGKGFIYAPQSLELVGEFEYSGEKSDREGWGLAYDGTRFIRSAGTGKLFFHDKETFRPLGSIRVSAENEKRARLLNELEYIPSKKANHGILLANIWKTPDVAIINPQSGKILAWLDLTSLVEKQEPGSGCANGLAWDAEREWLYVTGKLWKRMYVLDGRFLADLADALSEK